MDLDRDDARYRIPYLRAHIADRPFGRHTHGPGSRGLGIQTSRAGPGACSADWAMLSKTGGSREDRRLKWTPLP